MSATDVGAALPRQRMDLAPALTPLIVAAIAAPLIGSTSTFVTRRSCGFSAARTCALSCRGLIDFLASPAIIPNLEHSPERFA